MAYVNVAEWKTDQVCEWLKGLENSVLPYVHSFTNNKVNGQQLLSLRPEDLEQLGVFKFGHQEIILEAVENLRNFHYELDRENLQLLALRLSCQAHSLHNELSRQNDSKPVTTQTLSDVVAVVTTVKPLVRWLDRPPFSGQLEYNDKKTELLKLSIEMATCAQRDRFAEKPIEEIRETCGELAKLADYIIQDISDPMILQPACLDLATLKKRPGDDLGFYILASYNGTHQIADIKFGSVAHQCGKMEEGDEIVQVNYQTVVGWERKNVLELLNESPTEVLLTLKRRPRHTKIYGQIYIKPYRLPSNKKTTYTTRWQHNLPSPRPELLTIPDFTMPLPRHTPKDPSPEPASIIDTVSMLDTMATDDSSDTDSETEAPLSVRLYASKPRSLVQRRATITGASPTTKHAVDIEQFWKALKQERNTTFQLRDKAASCAHGLDNVPSNIRPQTCLGIEQSTNKRKKKTGDSSLSSTSTDEKKVQFNEKLCQLENIQLNELNNTVGDINLNTINHEKLNNTTVVNIQSNNNNINNNNSDIVVPLIKCKEMSNNNNVVVINDESTRVSNDIGYRKDRGKLDKSHSTPAYDFTDDTKQHNNNIIDINNQFLNNNKTVENFQSSDTNLSSISTLNKTEIHLSTVNNIQDNNCNAQNYKSIDNSNFIDTDKDQYINNHENEDRNVEAIIKVPELTTEITISNVHHDEENNLLNGIANVNNESCELLLNNNNNYYDNSNIENSMSDGIYKFSDNSTISRESSEEKSESTSSYMEGIYNSSSSETETPLKMKTINNINETIQPTSPPPPPPAINNNYNRKCLKTFDQLTDNKVPLDNLSSKINKLNINNKNITPQLPEKLRQTPPEPPPRKYFTKPSPLNINLINSVCDYRDKPKVPDRKDIVIKKDSIFNDKRSNSETIVPYHQKQTSNIEGYRDFIEKSNDFIDDSITPIQEQRTFGSNVDHFGYTEIYDRQLKDDKNSLDKYELFTEKFGGKCSPIISQSQSIIPSRTSDSPDGAGCSRQIQSPEIKPRTLEKDKSYEKGVVNRAMMVARSIGLHSGGSKMSSSGSPRSSRKRNILLAKRRDVSVKDIAPGDLEGWLTYRSRGAGGAWARSWFILKGSSLYRFKNQDSIKSDCLIVLPGFTASSATEVKSRKYAFKVYHTGTVFYFAADNEDSLSLWLDSINKVTLGADSHNRTSGLFSETDESDTESKIKVKNILTLDCKSNVEKTFGSLKKLGRKDSNMKDHDTGGASLDRKYLKFLGARTQNVPVPTAQFRSYRRVLPSSTPNKKQEPTANSPDLHVTVAGSTFYGLSSSQSATDVPSTSSQDMGDYRQSIERSLSNRGRRTKDGRGFITLEEFMLSHQNENGSYTPNRSASPRIARGGYQNEHDDNNIIYGQNHSFNGFPTNGMIYGNPRNGQIDEMPTTPNRSIYGHQRNITTEEEYSSRCVPSPLLRKPLETNEFTYGHNRRAQEGVVYYPPKHDDSNHWHQNSMREVKMTPINEGRQDCRNKTIELNHLRERNNISAPIVPYRNDDNISNGLKERSLLKESNRNEFLIISQPSRRYVRDNNYSGSSGDLSCCSSSETFQRVKKETSINRKGSFNFNDRRRDVLTNEKSWIDSLRRSDKKINIEKARLKCAAQYQPSPLPTASFENDGMKAAFEMHLDKNIEPVQKTPSKFKSLFSSNSNNKSPQKPSLDLPKESQKTLLGSPRLHRALFRDKNTNNQRQIAKINGQSPSDSGISHSFSSHSGISQSHPYNSQSFSSASSVSEWSLDAPTLTSVECTTCQQSCQKRPSNASIHLLPPPTLPYIPPPTSPPPPDDYPGLEYPPVFEPGTYSLSDASLLRNRGKTTPKDISD